ncbi:hypothetical protein VTL71DRAFT_12563 [Oculimacula yallundae]|uniref:Uncharacterized protein n=1 Tax=Oculimacula yallundae TaxID=86028 RepID=A0ABR4CMU5_9HELO
MNYAAAASGTRESSLRVSQQSNDSATKPAHHHHITKGHAQKPQSLPQRNPGNIANRKGNGNGNGRNEHVTRESHKPNFSASEELVYVLTFSLTDSLATPMNSLRERYFPARLNRTPAHLTLFHALPDSRFTGIDDALSRMCAGTKPFFVSSGKPFRMRLGIGVNVGKGFNRLNQVHEDLRSQWMPHLSEQDRGRWKPHWTVMNKVNEEERVDKAFQEVEKEITQHGLEGQAIGLDLWCYDRGNWIFAKEYTFTG